MDFLSSCTGFDWDEANVLKNWKKHHVSAFGCEQVFFNQPLITAPDQKHSVAETRYYALGRTDAFRLLFVAFAIRGKLLRVISARDMSRRERRIFEDA